MILTGMGNARHLLLSIDGHFFLRPACPRTVFYYRSHHRSKVVRDKKSQRRYDSPLAYFAFSTSHINLSWLQSASGFLYLTPACPLLCPRGIRHSDQSVNMVDGDQAAVSCLFAHHGVCLLCFWVGTHDAQPSKRTNVWG